MRPVLCFVLVASWSITDPAQAQQWVDLLDDPHANFHDVRAAFNAHWDGRAYERGKGWKQFKRMEWHLAPRLFPSGERPDPMVKRTAWEQLRPLLKASASRSANWMPMGPYTWSTLSYNPGNGRVNVITVDPITPTTIYVGTPVGGLWRSMDDGNTWTALFDDLPTLGVSGIAIDPTNTQVIYVATGDGDGRDAWSMGVIKSTDGGATWSGTGLDWSLAQVRTTRKLLMHPADPQILFCCSNDGLWKTTDGATTWTKVADGSFWDVEFRPGDPQFVYACTDQFHGSVDGGDNFLPFDIGLPPPDQVRRMCIAVTPADDQYVYVLCGREDDAGFQGLYRSINGGLTFSQRSTTPNIFGYADDGGDSGGQSWYDIALCADPADANTIHAAGINVWKSTNGGQNWAITSHWTWPSTIGYTHADVHAVECFNGQLYCGSDGGIFRSTNGGDDWTDLSAGLNITQFYRFGGSELATGTVMAGAQDNGCNLLSGGDWTHVLGADGMECAIDPADPQILYASSQNGSVYRSDDGGQSFNNITWSIGEEGAWVTPYAIDPNDAQTLYVGLNNVWKSTDQGGNWTSISPFGTSTFIAALAVAPSSSDAIYIIRGEQLRRTLNGGANWSVMSAGLPVLAPTAIAVHPLDAQTAWLAFSGYQEGEKVYVTTDAGTSWTNVSANLPNVPVNTIVFEQGTAGGVYVGTDLGVFYTDSTLGAWQPFSDGLPLMEVTELEINYATGMLRAATFGRGLWQSDLYEPSGSPPIAGFTTGALAVCAGEAITFHDASLEAAPGWTWDFPGGTPSSSTAASPSVIYPTSGIYTATLTVSNAFGNDSQVLPINVIVHPNEIDVNVVLDDYPHQSSWSITDGNGAVVVTGGPYEGLADGSTVNEQVCLSFGCYIFTMHDSYGDGLCCDFGNGSYTVTGPDGVLASGDAFTFGDSTAFCVNLGVEVNDPEGTTAGWIVRPLEVDGTFEAIIEAGTITGLAVLDARGRAIPGRTSALDARRWIIDLRDAPAGLYVIVMNDGRTTRATRVIRR